MIRFSCSECGLIFSVKETFAGRRSHCPTCKQALEVPAANGTPVNLPPRGEIEGPPSSLERVGVAGGVVLNRTAPTTGGGSPSIGDLLAHRATKTERYVVEAEIARGGMGAILRVVDCDIRREIAVKYLLDEQSHEKLLSSRKPRSRQLEHPNIVPIHELGVMAATACSSR